MCGNYNFTGAFAFLDNFRSPRFYPKSLHRAKQRADCIRPLFLSIQVKENTINFDEFCKAIASIVTGANYDPRREMHFIDPKTVDQWLKSSSAYWTPTSVSSICPFCDALTTFSLVAGATDQSNQAMDLHGICPKCKKGVSFFAIGCERCDRDENPDLKCASLWMHPIPQKKREVNSSFEILPSRVFSAYKASIQCFNSSIWTSTVTECGRILEGIAIDKIPNWNSNKTLDRSLKDLKENLSDTGYLELFDPILELANALRLGRNKSAHFDFEKEPDREVATEILDLTERLMDYFYVIPTKSQDLNTKIQALGLPEDLA